MIVILQRQSTMRFLLLGLFACIAFGDSLEAMNTKLRKTNQALRTALRGIKSEKAVGSPSGCIPCTCNYHDASTGQYSDCGDPSQFRMYGYDVATGEHSYITCYDLSTTGGAYVFRAFEVSGHCADNGCPNGAGGTFACEAGMGDKVTALFACESVYGSGGCVEAQCGCFYFWRKDDPGYCTPRSKCQPCMCDVPVGLYEFVYDNTCYKTVGESDGDATMIHMGFYDGESVVGKTPFVRRKNSEVKPQCPGYTDVWWAGGNAWCNMVDDLEKCQPYHLMAGNIGK